nr:MAG TPA: hypothetical protein [Caudoviricetes sp.]
MIRPSPYVNSATELKIVVGGAGARCIFRAVAVIGRFKKGD